MSLPGEHHARPLIDTLARTAATFYQREWMWGTSGNLSVKLASRPLTIAITGSGASKGELTYADLAIVPEEARASFPWLGPARARPSTETAIHLAIYQSLPGAGAVYHVHTVASTLVSLPSKQREGLRSVAISGLEMLKGWDVDWKQGELKAEVPVLPNRPHMDELAEDFSRLLNQCTDIPAVLVAGHGVTVWGKTPSEAQNRLEIAEFLFQVLWNQRQPKKA